MAPMTARTLRTSFALLALLLGLVALIVALAAQTVTDTLNWTQPYATGQSIADVQAFAYTFKVDTGTPVVITATCVDQAGTAASCSAPIATLAPGPHTITLTATNAFGNASTSSSGTLPLQPTTLKLTIKLTVP